MFPRLILVSMLIGFASPSLVLAQAEVLSTSPPIVEYQYQLNYERPWRGWPGPGLSLGGSLPANSRQGISSLYGLPFPVPLGAGVYMNPFAYSSRLPGPFAFGLTASKSAPADGPRQIETPVAPVAGLNNPISSNNRIQTVAQQVDPTSARGALDSTQANALGVDPIRRPISTSSPAAHQRSREIEEFGNEKLRLQQWTQAYVNYRNAVIAADDRAEAHVRLGFACTALNRFPEAILEFKRALSIDPTTGKSGETLATMFGPESQFVRTEIVHHIARWAREDLRDQDRLFLLGVVLLYNEDLRAREVLEAALKVTGSGDHLVALLTPIDQPGRVVPQRLDAPIPEPPESLRMPELHQQPLALHQADNLEHAGHAEP